MREREAGVRGWAALVTLTAAGLVIGVATGGMGIAVAGTAFGVPGVVWGGSAGASGGWLFKKLNDFLDREIDKMESNTKKS